MITQSDLIDQLRDLPTVRLMCETLGIDEDRIVVEGDRAISPAAVGAYALERIEIAQLLLDQPDAQRQGLMGTERDGRLVRWSRCHVLTYSVVRASFTSVARYDQVVEAMTIATAAWMNICGVEFEHREESDSIVTPTDDSVVFRVAGAASEGGLVAVAFFPDDREYGDKQERVIFVLDPWFAGGDAFDPIGVIRHEIGHVLGFRHEHIRPEAPQVFGPESLEDTRELTDYDPKSVMHYLAEGVGDPDLNFTPEDEEGARKVYGGPNSDYFFVR